MSDFQYKDGTDGSTVFYLYTGDLPSDITDGAPTPVISKDFIRTGFSATSRSLSGNTLSIDNYLWVYLLCSCDKLFRSLLWICYIAIG